MTLTNLERAELERAAVEEEVNGVEEVLENYPPSNLPAEGLINSLLEELNDQHKRLKEQNTKIVVAKPADLTPHSAAFSRIYGKIVKMRGKLYDMKSRIPRQSTPNSNTSDNNSNQPEIKLPRLELPQFNGDPSCWPTFRDMFLAAVDKKSSLTKIEKLTYLKSLTPTGEPNRLTDFNLEEANYDLAWAALYNRYDNEREQMFAVLKKLFNQTILTGSAVSLRTILDTTRGCIRTFTNLSGKSDHLFIYIIFQKMDSASKEIWFQSNSATSLPTLEELYKFLEQRASAVAAGSTAPVRHRQSESRAHLAQSTQSSSFNSSVSKPCSLQCSDPHRLYQCEEFIKLSPQQRSEHVRQQKLCFNCLNANHTINQCHSNHVCKQCGKKHHTLLHFNQSSINAREAAPAEAIASSSSTIATAFHGFNARETAPALLATAVIQVKGRYGPIMCRALLDSGSSNSFITLSCARKLALEVYENNTIISGITSATVGNAHGSTEFIMFPHFASYPKHNITGLVINKITDKLPTVSLNPDQWPHLHNIQLADPNYHTSGQIDILLGSDIFWEIIKGDIQKGSSGGPVGVNTSIGWLIGGPTTNSSLSAPTTNCFLTNVQLDHALEKFWKQDEISPSIPVLTQEEQNCENHFLSTVTRINGRFCANIPWKQPRQQLGESRNLALRRFLSMEKRISADNLKHFKSDYVDFMREYEDMGHMSKVSHEELSKPRHPVYYIPHHFVLKMDSTTTKFRVVFDASAKTSNRLSLNDIMMVGPVVQSSLFDIILRFRTNPIAFTSDICKMYRQISIPREDRDMHRILWRESPDQNITEYNLNTISYGTACAPYIATRCLKLLAEQEATRFPIASQIAIRDFYVDDCMSGESTVERAKKAIQQLILMCDSAHFPLRKWTCNNNDVLLSIPEELRETKKIIPLDDSSTIKTLGIHWQPREDFYRFKINISPASTSYTKRKILSEMAQLFDPIGWLAPITIKAKIFMQQLWKEKYGWDTVLPQHVQAQWECYISSLKIIESLRIPRLIIPYSTEIHLIGFADASLSAYGAVVYTYCSDQYGTTKASLVTSKTRVASLTSPELPLLELSAATLLAELLTTVKNALQIKFTSVRAYSDSTITLAWIKSDPNRWKMYVRNRVIKCQTHLPQSQWYHIRGADNPADCISRGLSPNDLPNYELWWNGSSTALSCSTLIPDHDHLILIKQEKERKVICSHANIKVDLNLIHRFSCLTTLVRVSARIFRLQSNYKKRKLGESIVSGSITSSELKTALQYLIVYTQHQVFSSEYCSLTAKLELNPKSNILSLNPFLDNNGLIRVGGRLQNSIFSYDRKHPVLLPRHHHLTNLIVSDTHLRYFHTGPQNTLAILSQKYWILRGQDAVKFNIKRCTTCVRNRGKTMEQMMGNLPSARVTPSRPFTNTGVGLAGPFTLKNMGRSKITFKSWLVLFVCFSTRAIHLEITTSLSSESFMAALRRFASRRSKPNNIFSDCGTNFVGAKKELSLVQNRIANQCADEGIKWHFNPPGAPHFGGLWEAGVKSVKHHLTRVMNPQPLTFEEMTTLVTQIEAILNSRPLTPISTDPNEFEVLTPAHFLVGGPLLTVPDDDFSEININRLGRWQLLQQKQQSFWRRWQNEYITRMQQRPKWMKVSPKIQLNDIVIIKDDNLPPARWRLGRVISLHPGSDNLTRVVTMKTQNGEIKRPVAKLCRLLPPQEESLVDNSVKGARMDKVQ